MFQTVAFLALGITIIALAIYSVVLRRRGKIAVWDLFAIVRWIGVLELCDKLTYLSLLLSLLTLGFTSLWPAMQGEAMGGYLLMLHVTAGGVFAVVLAALLVFRAESHCMGRCTLAVCGLTSGAKFCFWALAISGLVATVSILLSMTPLFGTAGQALLFEIHRYSGIVVVCAAMGYLYLGTLKKG